MLLSYSLVPAWQNLAEAVRLLFLFLYPNLRSLHLSLGLDRNAILAHCLRALLDNHVHVVLSSPDCIRKLLLRQAFPCLEAPTTG